MGLARQLKSEHFVDLVVAVIHMPWEEQLQLVEAAPDIDLVLSGHDHFWKYQRLNGVDVVEGDINLEKISVVDIEYFKNTKPLIKAQKVTYIIPDDRYPKDPEMEAIVQEYV